MDLRSFKNLSLTLLSRSYYNRDKAALTKIMEDIQAVGTKIQYQTREGRAAYRGGILWKAVCFNKRGVQRLKQKELNHRIRTKDSFKDFKFDVVSTSTV